MTTSESYSAWFVGEGSLVIQAANIWTEKGHRVRGVASKEPSVVRWAKAGEIDLVDPDELSEPLARSPFDYLFSIVNLVMLPEELIRLPRKLAINFHDGPLPRYAGVNATVWALLAGERAHGVTFHEMTSEADTGCVLAQTTFEVVPDETAFSLNAKCFDAGIETFRELADRITDGTLARVPQDLSQRTYFGFYQRPDAAQILSFDEPGETLEALVRALDFGTYPNPVGTAKLVLESGSVSVAAALLMDHPSTARPGTVTTVDAEGIVVATGSRDLRLTGLRDFSGASLAAGDLADRGITQGVTLPILDAGSRRRLGTASDEAAKSEGYFLRRLSDLAPLESGLPGGDPAGSAVTVHVDVPNTARVDALTASVLAFFARYSSELRFDVAYADPALRERCENTWGIFSPEVPLRVDVRPDATVASAVDAIESERKKLSGRFPFATDLLRRQPRARGAALPVAVLVDVEPDAGSPFTSDLLVRVDTVGSTIRLVSAPGRATAGVLERLARRLSLFLKHAAEDPSLPLRRVRLVSAEEEEALVHELNRTARDVSDTCVHALFEAQAARAPDRTAVAARGETLTFRELDRRANALAHALVAKGVTQDTLVGVFLERSVHLMVAVLGIQKAGGAYVPLDPEYPTDRIAFMVEDADLSLVVTDRASAGALASGKFERVVVDDGAFDGGAQAPPEAAVTAENLAYVIYTSGSTGKPKGVMIEHRNVSNFFAGMEEIFRGADGGTWLAVTSLSFDISVLELFGALTHGLSVVLASGHAGPKPRSIDFSLFYFSASSVGGGPEHYRLLLEGARFADAHGFAAVWTPERHFHEFGGLYPNPAVASAAIAMITKNVAIRAGSCVSPLHTPIRIAEEWSLVDNLSNGRVGISFASGWQPNDFAIRPQAFERRQESMYEDIETVRRLWRGETVEFPNGIGKPTKVRTLPRPVQEALPVWVTAAGNPKTFEAAGRAGANLLTHLLGQTLSEVEGKIRIYRDARREAGHAGDGVVTLMLHTFLGENDEGVKAAVRDPMKEYLRSAVGLIKEAAWSFPTFKQKSTTAEGNFTADQLTPEELDAVLEHAFERYYETSGFFGTEARALALVERVRSIGVDEIACLIDFGVPTDQVLASLPLLATVLAKAHERERGPRESLGDLLKEHAVTHLQCTPSMAGMLVLDDDTREGLGRLSTMLVGGEALSPSLARQLTSLVPERLFNMYGPTETTIWSSYHRVAEIGDEIPIGRPIANTDVLILDKCGGLVPPGEKGELAIGGKGVARGYFRRKELTDERFIPHPLRAGDRIYRTGDLAYFDRDGALRFKGRLDHQVKVRGYRIELGEIEARLGDHPAVRECAVIVREDTSGDKRLVAYLVPERPSPAPEELRRHLASHLPDYMVPSAFVTLAALPLTPNKKVDRKALPKPEGVVAKATSAQKEAPANELEELIASIWRDLLGRTDVSASDNFFDLGGHSLLTIQVLGRLKSKVERPVSLVDLFRYPTIRSLSEFLRSKDTTAGALKDAAARGAERQRLRRAMMDRRKS